MQPLVFVRGASSTVLPTPTLPLLVPVVLPAPDVLSVTSRNVFIVPAAPQATTIGQRPAVVLLPTFHVQLTRPASDGRWGLKPAAFDGPLL